AALSRPVTGMLAYVCYSLLAPHSLTWGRARTFPHVQLIAICTIVGYMVWSEPKRFPRQRELILLLALWGMFGISTVFALYPDLAFNNLRYISKVWLMVILSTSIINTPERLQSLIRVVALSIGFYGLKTGLYVIMTGGHSTVFGPDDSFISANNSLGMALAMNVPLLFYLSQTGQRRWLRGVMRLMAVFSYPAVLGTFSRGSWLALAAVTALRALKSKYKVLATPLIFCILLSTPTWLPQVASQQMADRFDTIGNYEEDQSAQSRFWNWEFCTRVGLARPLTGGGFYLYSRESYAKFFPEFLTRWPEKVWTCHNAFLTPLAEHGFPGWLLWLGLLGSCLLSLRRLRAVAKTRAEVSWVLPYAEMLQAAFIGFMVSGAFVDNTYFEMYYLLAAAVASFKETVSRQVTEASPSPVVTRAPGFVLAPGRG
ncbi:MAG TPA: putative O-glycosylation ligase, exosortase A system-associated, partial [Candidatus Binatia bacterium]|nr:putative O-glycosylation ligase, exosortase A system-associated [Candidatus Binatia bacterium]